jgi:hypothetical protein
MALQTRDREFRHPRISYLDFKLLEMDRVLTRFWPVYGITITRAVSCAILSSQSKTS